MTRRSPTKRVPESNKKPIQSSPRKKESKAESFDNYTFLRTPITNTVTLIKIIFELIWATPRFIFRHFIIFTLFPSLIASFYYIEGPHAEYRQIVTEISLFSGWWILLGIASSVGFGTGLHTFVIYLGPHIAKVAIAANECNQIPSFLPNKWTYQTFAHWDTYEGVPTIGVFDIYNAIMIEAFLWGLGTAIGELPPYFFAKAASIAGGKSEELEGQEGIMKRFSDWCEPIIKKHAFIVIFWCAAVPNPFFDLAGLICGHFQIPFFTFFGATIMGKAVIKATFQSLLTIVTFSHHIVENVIMIISSIIPAADQFLRNELEKQKSKLYEHDVKDEQESIIAKLWGYVILAMIAYFLYAFLNAIVQFRLKEDAKKNK